MAEENDDLTGVFDRLRRDVTSTVDAEAALTELERREQRARGRASRARWLAAAAAIVVLVAGGVRIARWRSTESDVNVGPATTEEAPPTTTTVPVWECTWDEVVDLSAVVPERFDRASSAVQGEPGAQWCARRWGAIGHPDMSSITQYLPEIQLPGLVPEALAAGFTWGTVDGMHFLRHDEAPQWGLVADGLTEAEWTELRQSLVG